MIMKLSMIRKNLRIYFENQEALIFVPEKNETYELNEIATRILKLCDGKHTIDQITDVILSEYNCANKIEIKKDVKNLINELKNKKIIKL